MTIGWIMNPRIYVASLADYNNGELHGVWIDLDIDSDYDGVMEQVNAMLAESPSVESGDAELAEEFAIHDSDEFGGYEVHEYASLRDVVAVAAAIAEHGEPMAKWLALDVHSSGVEGAVGEFADAYMGTFSEVKDWAWQELESSHPEAYKLLTDDTPGLVFDHEGYVGVADNDGWQFETVSDGVAVFCPQ